MKKILLGTTVLASVLAFSTAVEAGGMAGKNTRNKAAAPAPVAAAPALKAAAGALDVTVGGFIDFQTGFADQDSVYETGANSRDFKMQNDSEVHIKASGKADNGLAYGGVIELEADVTSDADSEGLNADKTYIWLESAAGKLKLGNHSGAEHTLKVDASSIARATGGIDGDWYDFVNETFASFIISPDLPASHAAGIKEDATKVTYYTPRFSGAQLGVSFTPDEGDGGTAAGFTGELNGNQENVFGVGANYTGQVQNVGVQLSATGEFGSAELAGTEDAQAWAIGGALDLRGFSVAASWGDWADSGLAVGSGDDQNYWTLGAAYETGPFGVSVTYLNSEREAGVADNEFSNLAVGADYQLAPGLVPYVEVNFFDLDAGPVATPDNDGSVVLVGAQLNF